jgi:hypothetical protein
MTDVPKNSSIGLIPVFEASATFFAFGSSLSPVSQEQIVIKARYESASASALLLKMKVRLFVEERMSSLSLYTTPSMPSSNSIGLVPSMKHRLLFCYF